MLQVPFTQVQLDEDVSDSEEQVQVSCWCSTALIACHVQGAFICCVV